METIQNIFVDSLNGFSLSQVPLFLFQLLCAGLAGFVIQFALNRKTEKTIIENAALMAMAVALLTGLAKYALPVAVICAAAVLLLFKGKDAKRIEILGQFLVVLVGIGCGMGSVVQTAIGTVLMLGIILFTPLKK